MLDAISLGMLDAVINPLLFIKLPVWVGTDDIVMYPLLFVSCEVVVGTDDDVINPLLFIKLPVWVGTDADVMYPELFVSWEVVVGTDADVINPELFIKLPVCVGIAVEIGRYIVFARASVSPVLAVAINVDMLLPSTYRRLTFVVPSDSTENELSPSDTPMRTPAFPRFRIHISPATASPNQFPLVYA